MKTSVNPERFADLFRKYRLKAGISTLSAFAELMRDEGYYYDTSLYTYWQNGKRLPNGREVVIAVISILASSDGIETIAEANEILASVGERDLQKEEEEKINSRLDKNYFDTLPDKINNFVGRDGYIKDIGWDLVQKQKVILHGSPGVGKTALSIEIGHLLKAKFKQGMYWIRVDIISLSDIINELLNFFGSSMPPTQDISVKLSELRAASIGKECLLILDNVDYDKKFLQLWSALEQMNISILITSIKPPSINGQFKQYKLTSFNSDEFLLICDQILGRPFVLQNRDKIDTLGKVLGYLPIATAIILNQVAENPSVLDKYIDHSHDQGFEIRELKYDEKTLASSLDYVYSMLNKREQSVLTSCSIFAGPDFSIEAVAAINEISKNGARRILEELVNHSLVERSKNRRYMLHPIIKEYLSLRPIDKKYVIILSVYYMNRLNQIKIHEDNIFLPFLNKEIENILSLINKLYLFNQYSKAIQMWEYINFAVFIKGDWHVIRSIQKILEGCYLSMGDYRGLCLFYINDLGRVFYFLNKKHMATQYIDKALSIAVKHKDNFLIAFCEQKYAMLDIENNNYHGAKIKILNSIKLFRDDITNESIQSHTILSVIDMIEGRYDAARRRLLKLCRQSRNYEDAYTMSSFMLVVLYIKVNMYKEAESLLIQGLARYDNFKNVFQRGMTHVGLFKVYINTGDSIRANKHLLAAKQVFKRMNLPKIKSVLWNDLILNNR